MSNTSSAAEPVEVVMQAAERQVSRKDRKKQELQDRYEQGLRDLSDRAKQVNCEGDNPFSVTLETNQMTDGSRDISFNKVSVSVNGKTLFNEATVKFSAGLRYGLMGPNGRGKSTILRLLSTRELPVQSNLDLLLVEQEQEFTGSEETAVNAVLNSHKKRRLYMEEAATLRAKEELERDELERLSFLEEELDVMGAQQAEAKVRRILFGLGFPTDWHDRPTKSFSGGWRKRVALASAVFIEPDVLMLDEPTNHLDLNAVIWLESYLATTYDEKARRPKILIVVSHDAGFLDAVCTHIVHVDCYKLNEYKGGFTSFERQLKQSNLEFAKKYDNFKKTIREKKRGGMSNADVDEWLKTEVQRGRLDPRVLEGRKEYVVNFPFEVPPKLPDACVCKLQDVSFNYPGGPVLYEGVNCALWTDSRIVLCGPNGIGKSTLLNLMTGLLEPSAGFITLNRLVRVGRYNQHFVDKLPLEKTAVECMQALGVHDEVKARSLLGRFGLEGIVHKNQIATLSGGQKARVAFAAISAESPHFLLLDEPTNHLDVEAIEALCDAIRTFEGGVLVVTHDTRLIESTEMQIWVAGNRNVVPFNGSLSDYKAHVQEQHLLEEAQKVEERKAAQEERLLDKKLTKEGAVDLEEAKRHIAEEKKEEYGKNLDNFFDQLQAPAEKKKKKKKDPTKK
ncbi:ATP-binding protein cassette, sub-family F, member 1 [Strigomonas culicis]|uniref:ATP-binding protein cassette, sub-family F, member 1 n=1 Tax=Strigomonas culicis TaxID=28005 RepID=S9TXE8_9TRYP|nr:ATP-binding protein cassette, sub-family F, member 1 [Strigomonas culicis]EPY25525.1 ATP-binding protein cassette, sub-family F, member 1 [Strigomonas culicis]|eukprot:EPY23142.1 ATP-binding protein cassette, sub-family F, member 1 [Strigomonas culicis]